MPAPFPPAIGLILVPPWSTWSGISRARIGMGAIASRNGYVLIETYAVKGDAIGDDLMMTSLNAMAQRCSVRVLLVAEDVPMSFLTAIDLAGRLSVTVVAPDRLNAVT